MCGIFGVFARPGALVADERLAAALRRLAHRGPDALGLLRREQHGLALGHARLSILDLDARSNQPFVAADCVLAFNGEIFNYRHLRAELERSGVAFDTTSDTEVVARGFRHWGDGVFARLRGMYAIALWDEHEQRLHLARDEFGIKPLCVLQRGDEVVFASEVKPIAELHDLDVDTGILTDVLRWGFQMQDRSIYRGVEFLAPGTRSVWRRDASGALRRTDHVTWSVEQAFRERVAEPDDAAIRAAIESSVRDHLIADVPVAVALSGGLDSSIVTAAAARVAPGLHAHTFTLAPDSDPEVEHACMVAEHLGLVHDIARLRPADLGAWLRAVAWHLEEPITNVNALPGFALAAGVRARNCKVVLVGEGADELFGGYPWYRLPLDPAIGADPGAVFDAYVARRGQRQLLPCLRPEAQRLADDRLRAQRADYAAAARRLPGSPLDAFLCFELRTQLQYSQLLRVDRMFMAHGVEARVPFLYRQVLEVSAAIADARRLLPPDGPGRREKVALGRAFADALPPAVVQRPKFGAPGTVDLWSTWIGGGIDAAFVRCLDSADLRAARERLDHAIDWRAVATARLEPKNRFAVALLLEAVDGVLSRRPRPDAMPSLPMTLLPSRRGGVAG